MTSLMNPRRVALAAVLMAVALPLVLTTARAQGPAKSSDNNGVPQQIATLRADLADARALIKKLQASLDMEAMARMDDHDMLQNSIDMEATVRMEAVSMLQNSIDMEAAVRMEADAMLQNSVDAGAADGGAQITQLRDAIKAIRLPQYLIESDQEPPGEIDETVGQ